MRSTTFASLLARSCVVILLLGYCRAEYPFVWFGNKAVNSYKIEEQLDKRVSKIEQDIQELVKYIKTGPGVGFHVALEQSIDIYRGKQIHFDKVLWTEGSGYSLVNSMFIVPKSGTYLLALSFACIKGGVINLSIMQNGDPIFNTLCNNRNGESSTQGGGTTIWPLNYGDRVYVEMIWPEGVIETVYGNSMTSFSGCLLKLH